MSEDIKKEEIEKTEDTQKAEEIKKVEALSPETKKTIWEWVSYLSKSLLTAILKKLSGQC